jgi:Transposase DDE domain
MRLFGFLATDYELTLDRTNWQWGKKNINILMLAVVYKGIAIPIYWLLLNNKGNSNTKERIALLKRFIKRFGKTRIIRLLADREFIGKDWFTWLNREGIDMAIRIKKNAKVSNSRGELVPAQQLFWSLKAGESQRLEGVRTMNSVDVYLSALRLPDGELLIVATGNANENTMESYARRWQIETLFSCLKSRGFNFEDTHVTDRRRIKRLLIVAVIAFCWAHRVGEWQHEQVKTIKIKKHQRLAKSIFRVGLDIINDALFKLAYSCENALKLLFPFLEFNQLRAPD